jgi:hypothetical protein
MHSFLIGFSGNTIVRVQISNDPSDRMLLLMVKKYTEPAVDTVVMEARQHVTAAVMGVQVAANMGGGAGGG